LTRLVPARFITRSSDGGAPVSTVDHDRAGGGLAGQRLAGSNQAGMRAWNERLVLTLVRRHGALAKADIARATGLSAQTVSVIMRALERDGLLVRRAPVRGRVGQPSVPMALDPEGAFFFGLKIGRRSAELALVDFAGHIHGQRRMAYAWPRADDVLAFAEGAVASLRGTLAAARAPRLAGLGVAIPFRLWEWAGSIGAPTDEMEAWRQLDVRTVLQQRLGLPVFLENDATAACAAELILGRGPTPRDFVYFYIGFFVGGGVVLDGAVLTGPTGNAAALGSMPVPMPDGQGACQLIDVASIATLEARLRARGLPSEPIWQGPEGWPIDPSILGRWLDDAARALAWAIVGCVAVTDAPDVVIDGWLPAEVRRELVARTRARLDAMNLAGINRPRLSEGTLGAEARTLGAASRPLAARFLVEPEAQRRP
jgi:predicted NBD/HSP70 family sugar kinase